MTFLMKRGQPLKSNSRPGWPSAVTLLLAVAAVVSAQPSLARPKQQPPDGAALVRQMHDRYAGRWYKTLTFVQRTTFPGRPDQTWYETAELPGRLRIDIAPVDSMNTLLFIGDSTIRFRGGQRAAARAGGNPLAVLLADVFASPADESIARITRYGFDLSRLSSGTWKGRPVWIVGSMGGDTTVSQFWVDQERQYVVRIIEKREGQVLMDYHISGHQPAAGGWLERELHFYRDGVEIQGEYYTEVRVNPPVDPALWSTTVWKRPSWIP
jgi:hypothetical protein